MNSYEYLTPETLDSAVSLHQAHGDRAMYIAGGTDVMVKIKSGKIAPDYLISLRHINSGKEIVLNRETGELSISAFATHRMLEKSQLIRLHYPILYDAVRNIGSVQIRNVATIGGNIVNAVPSADGAIPLLALDAAVEIYGSKGKRRVDLVHFFEGPGQTVLEPGEIVTKIVAPALLPRTGGAYKKFGRREAMELPILGVGVLLSLKKDSGKCARVRICLGVAAPTPMRAVEAERFLQGKKVDEETLHRAGEIAARESRVRDSVRGVAWYRREMVGVFVRRMGLLCLERIKEKEMLQ
ncbi:MAG: FAD binding domain-containing protein [Desulfobacterales bacterium]|nr:FAD binding domain-containing protein [Desulfobacterales bacterium]